MDPRHLLGAGAERAAAWFLSRHGVELTASNVTVDTGEVDLVGRHRGERLVVEVRSTAGELRLDDMVDPAKLRTVRRLAGILGISRVDAVGVGVGRDGLRFHWSRRL